MTSWVFKAVAISDNDECYRKRLYQKTGLILTAGGSDDYLINLEGHEGEYIFMHAREGTMPLDEIRVSPASADEKYEAGSSDEEEDEFKSGGDGCMKRYGIDEVGRVVKKFFYCNFHRGMRSCPQNWRLLMRHS